MKKFADIRQQLLWELLSEKAQADNLGEHKVKEVCRMFLKFKGIHGVEPTKRKAIPKQWTDEAFIRQKGVCNRCNNAMDYNEKDPDLKVTGDHIVPLQKGGKHTKRNIQALHDKCNKSKGTNDFYTESRKLGTTIIEQIRKTAINEPEKPNEATEKV